MYFVKSWSRNLFNFQFSYSRVYSYSYSYSHTSTINVLIYQHVLCKSWCRASEWYFLLEFHHLYSLWLVITITIIIWSSMIIKGVANIFAFAITFVVLNRKIFSNIIFLNLFACLFLFPVFKKIIKWLISIFSTNIVNRTLVKYIFWP